MELIKQFWKRRRDTRHGRGTVMTPPFLPRVVLLTATPRPGLAPSSVCPPSAAEIGCERRCCETS